MTKPTNHKPCVCGHKKKMHQDECFHVVASGELEEIEVYCECQEYKPKE